MKKMVGETIFEGFGSLFSNGRETPATIKMSLVDDKMFINGKRVTSFTNIFSRLLPLGCFTERGIYIVEKLSLNKGVLKKIQTVRVAI